MRRCIVMLAIVGALFVGTTLPAMADYPPVVTVNPGDTVSIADGIFIEVETNGTVQVTDGIFVRKYSLGGQPLSISVGKDDNLMIIIPGGCLDKDC